MTKSEQYDLMFDPDKQPDAAQRILAKSKPAFQEAVAEIEVLCRSFHGDFVRRHYKIGEKVLALDSDSRRYGDNAVKRLGKILGWADETLNLDLHLVKAFSPEQIEEFCVTVLPNGQPLSYRHLTMIAPLTPALRQSEVLTFSRTVRVLNLGIVKGASRWPGRSKQHPLPRPRNAGSTPKSSDATPSR